MQKLLQVFQIILQKITIDFNGLNPIEWILMDCVFTEIID